MVGHLKYLVWGGFPDISAGPSAEHALLLQQFLSWYNFFPFFLLLLIEDFFFLLFFLPVVMLLLFTILHKSPGLSRVAGSVKTLIVRPPSSVLRLPSSVRNCCNGH